MITQIALSRLLILVEHSLAYDIGHGIATRKIRFMVARSCISQRRASSDAADAVADESALHWEPERLLLYVKARQVAMAAGCLLCDWPRYV